MGTDGHMDAKFIKHEVRWEAVSTNPSPYLRLAKPYMNVYN